MGSFHKYPKNKEERAKQGLLLTTNKSLQLVILVCVCDVQVCLAFVYRNNTILFLIRWAFFLANGYLTQWTSWSACSESCGGGTRDRSRTCVEPENGGQDCPAGDLVETGSCSEQNCPGIIHTCTPNNT